MRNSQAYSDTDPQAFEVWLNLLRKMSESEKIATVFDLTRFARGMAELGVRSRYPNASEREVFLRTAALYLSREQMIHAYRWDPRSMSDPAVAFRRIVEALDRMEVPYCIVGSSLGRSSPSR